MCYGMTFCNRSYIHGLKIGHSPLTRTGEKLKDLFVIGGLQVPLFVSIPFCMFIIRCVFSK